MNTQPIENTPAIAIGTPMGGGFYAGRFILAGKPYALIVAPKADGEQSDAKWIARNKSAPEALSYNDGHANTLAMAEAGSKLVQWALGLSIGGESDWYLPSQDELEILYRNLKPTAQENYCYARSGINLSAIEPTRPYTPDLPAQTTMEAFQAGGTEAFSAVWYWSSTQHAANSDYAWLQDFDYGNQITYDKSDEGRARAVRRLPL
jgi:hypothetical protein